METLTKKPKKVVPTVTKTTDDAEVVPSEQPQEAPIEAPVISLKDFDPKKIAMAEEMGIPLKKLVDWVNRTDATVKVIIQSMPNQQQIEGAVVSAIQQIQQKQREEYAKAVAEGKIPKGGRGGLGQLEELRAIGQMFGLGGGGGDSWIDDEMRNLFKDTMRANIARTKSEASILTELGKTVITKVMAKGVKDTVDLATS